MVAAVNGGPGWLEKLNAMFQPGGALGTPQMSPELQAIAEQQGMTPGQGLGSLTQNPAFMMGMGLLSGSQPGGNPFQGAMQGLQGANQAAIAQEDRVRQQALREALMQHFGLPGTADAGAATGDVAGQLAADQLPGAGVPMPGPNQSPLPGAPQMSPVPPGGTAQQMSNAGMAGPATNGNQYPPGGGANDRNRLLALLLSQNQGNNFAGINPFMM